MLVEMVSECQICLDLSCLHMQSSCEWQDKGLKRETETERETERDREREKYVIPGFTK